MSKIRPFLVVAISAAIAAGLSGCFALDPPVGGAAIKRDGHFLEIAICVNVNDAHGDVSYRDLSVENDWKDAWTFDVGGDLVKGTVISTDPLVTAPFLGEERLPVPLDPGVEIEVKLDPGDAASDGVFAGFTIPDDGLPEDLWLQQGGTTTDRPCP